MFKLDRAQAQIVEILVVMVAIIDLVKHTYAGQIIASFAIGPVLLTILLVCSPDTRTELSKVCRLARQFSF